MKLRNPYSEFEEEINKTNQTKLKETDTHT